MTQQEEPKLASVEKGEKKIARILVENKYEGMPEGTPVPHFIEIRNQSDLRKEMVTFGPVKGADGANLYVTADNQRLRFDAKSGAFLGKE